MSENGKTELFRYGSTWVRADFHLHTRADREFCFNGEENSFVSDYISVLKAKDIRVGVITNHNKFDGDEFKALHKKARKEEIFLLPGVELSVGDGANGIHTLVVFSERWLEDGQDYINSFLHNAFEGQSPQTYETANGRSSLNIVDTIKKLESYNRDFFVIFAHVEQKSGLFNELKGGRLRELANNAQFRKRVLGLQKMRTRDLRNRVQQWFGDWYPTKVEGSDPKTVDEIGNGEETWLKIGDYTFEAVKFSLIDRENRTRGQSCDRHRHSHIRSISFEGGILDGETISLSPELNTFIGIRGSGKSAVLETIRYVLGIPFGERASDKDYKKSLVSHALGSGGKAVISAVDNNGQCFTVTRVLGEDSAVYFDDEYQPGVSIRETVVRNPLYFGQKDLSATGEGFEQDLVEKLAGDELENVRNSISEQKERIHSYIDQLNNSQKTEEKLKEYTDKKKDAGFRLKIFREHGVAGQLKKQTAFEKDARTMDRMLKDCRDYWKALASVLDEHEDQLKNHLMYMSDYNKEFFEEFFEHYKKILHSFEAVQKELEKTRAVYADLSGKKSSFEEKKKAMSEEFSAVRRDLEQTLRNEGKSLNIEEFPDLQKTIETSERMIRELQKQQEQRGKVYELLQSELKKLDDLYLREFREIEEKLTHINNNNTALSIEGRYKGDKSAFLSYFKDILRGSRIREATLHNLVENYSDFGQMFNNFEAVKNDAGSSPEHFESYFFENLKHLLTWQVPNTFIIRYQDKELKHHSLGQRASALILFILSQNENDIVIIDQPEDDLDNQTIYEDVIKLLVKMKPDTQFVFATHNPNIPVLGDAEQIHVCRYRDGVVQYSAGSIDNPVVQSEIVTIMEGGSEAFNRRKEIYGIWNPQN